MSISAIIDILLIASSLMLLAVVLYMARLVFNLFRAHRDGANGLTLAMALLFSAVGLYFLWSLGTAVSSLSSFGIYSQAISIERLIIQSARTIVLAFVLWSCWNFDLNLYQDALKRSNEHNQ